MSRARQLIISWDFLGAALTGAVTHWLLPARVANAFAKDLYDMGVNVASIVFSVFFTALAVVMTSSDDEFVRFLRKENFYADLMWTFEATLVLLFVDLVASIVGFAATAALAEAGTQPSIFLSAFALLLAWGLCAAINAALDSIRYAKRRGDYMDFLATSRAAS